MDWKLSAVNSTIKFLRRPANSVMLNHRARFLWYSMKSAPDDKDGSSMHGTGGENPRRGMFQLKTAKQELNELFSDVLARVPDMGIPNDTSRINELNIQMLPQTLYEQIFHYGNKKQAMKRNDEDVGKSRNALKKLGLWSDKVKKEPDVTLKLPKLKGENIEDHFWHIGLEQAKPYRDLMYNFVKQGIPEAPKEWVYQSGWTKYQKGKTPVRVPFPDEDALVLDVEVSVNVSEAPVIAAAVSADAWYGWVSQTLTEDIEPIGPNRYVTDMLIPLEGEKRNLERCRIVIGHNVSYDRARIREQYHMESSSLRFMDTMSLHTCTSGASKFQKDLEKEVDGDDEGDISKRFCLTSLKDLYMVYCKKSMTKETRDVFVKGGLQDVRDDFQNLMDYTAQDVKATYEIFQALLPVFFDRFPHPVTLAGMLEMGMAYITVNENWDKYVNTSQEVYEEMENEMSFLLAKKCDDACRLMHRDAYKKDLWMWSEDWSTQELKLTKKNVKKLTKVEEETGTEDDDEVLTKLMRKFKDLFDLERILPVRKPVLPGYPAWYRKLCQKPDTSDWRPGPQSLHTTLTVAPKVLNLTYDNYPLHNIREFGWGILVADVNAKNVKTSLPYDKLKEVTLENLRLQEEEVKPKGAPGGYVGSAVPCGHVIDECIHFLRLPHKDGQNKNVGQPLCKSFATAFSFNLLGGSDNISRKGIRVNSVLSYWRNNRDRISGQTVVWLKPSELDVRARRGKPVGVIIPQIVVCGTLTRRAVEKTWLTASNAIADRVGSELRAMVQAPPGYHFVGADVDSQELWIASLIGDSKASRVHGGTPFGWMTISGSKANETDLHSVTAKAAGISRDHAKVINYARIYGAGVKYAGRLLQQFNPSMSCKEVEEKAKTMYALTKGRQKFAMKEKFRRRYGSYDVENVYGAMKIAKSFGLSVEDVFEKRIWVGGTESDVFNELEKIATCRNPETPFLRSRLSRALEPRFQGDTLCINTRINWVVQSGAVDFLHLMLVCMRWLTNGRIRFCLSFHDEVRYLVPSEHRYQAALALQITNLLTRSFFSHRVGLYDLPFSVAFFSSVEVDTTMRKEASDDCRTPSNPHGLKDGYGIPHGESLNIYDVIKKSGGCLNAFRNDS